ncbi:MAG TPA: family 43 glycosylhydrolase [Bryobacteraceae bacterium]|nr:family 43 glycosylhydrolase [Bryobacteraceae bacterium]
MRRRELLALAPGSLLAAASHAQPAAPQLPRAAFRLATGFPVPDPFCMRTKEGWYLTGTQHARGIDDRRFSLFFSPDLKTWRDLGPILVRPEYEGSHKANYWAPEFMEHGGTYYLYYTSDSFGDPERRFVRVATSSRLTGPYRDSGDRLVTKPSIDGHPYFVSSGEGWLFYCGNEGNPHVGQLLVDRFLSPSQLENKPRKVFPNETVAWEEGAFIIRRLKVYYLFSSMGNWRNGTYHVRVARSRSIEGPWERLMENGAPYRVLQTVEGQSGAGHNSLFRGPDGDWWICYHAWDPGKTGRYPWAAPLSWDSRGYPAVQQLPEASSGQKPGLQGA